MVMFTKEQRAELSRLSVILYGTASKWQKLYDQGQFKIPDGTREIEEKVETIQFPRTKTGKSGQIVGLKKAIERDYVKEGVVPETRKRTVTDYREPTYDELVKALNLTMDAQRIAHLRDEELIQVIAHRYVKGELQFPVCLTMKDGPEYAQLVDEMMLSVPEARREEIKGLILAGDKKITGLPVDAFTFISDFVFALTQPDAAKAMAVDAVESVDLSEKKPKVPFQILQSLGVAAKAHNVSPKDKAARRAKNKAARQARKINRRRGA
jgi:hypothetical protein